MGIYATRFYFKAALPQISAIKTKFKEITGLDLDYSPAIELNELATDAEDFLYYFSKSIEGGKHLKYTYAWFSCEGFANVYLDDYMRPAEQSFYLECGIRIENMYFFHALSKTMLELGGNIFSYNIDPLEKGLDIDRYLEPYQPHERTWKRIKKWGEMNAVERAAFKGKYV